MAPAGEPQGPAQGPRPVTTTILSRLLLERGLLSSQQLKEALLEQARSAPEGSGNQRPLSEILVGKGYLTEAQIRAAVDGEGASRPRRPLPSTFGRYTLLRELGRGGMGVIYEANDPQLDRKLALKLMIVNPADEPEVEEERFAREAQIAARLRHPGIVTIYESGILDGQRFIAMERIDGRPFSDWRASVPLPRQVEVLRQVALAVHHAHEQGVLHRDLKPQNILVDAEGRATVTDFGLAKASGTSAKLSLTAAGMVVGTPAYMSPEQAQGKRDVDRRTDVYSMGVMLYEILTGRPPFQGDSAIDVLTKTLRDPVTPPSQVRRDADRTLENICLKALAKRPAGRYPTAEAFAADLARWLGGEKFRVAVPGPGRARALAYAAGAALLLGATALFLGPRKGDEIGRAERALSEGRADEALVLFTQALQQEPASEVARAGREEALRRIRARDLPAPPPEEHWKEATDVLRLVDPERDAVSGPWSRSESGVVTGADNPSRLQVPFCPPREYDVRLTFTRDSGAHCVSLILSKDDRPFIWVMEPPGLFGLEKLYDIDFRRNPTSVQKPLIGEHGRRYVAVVQVRDDRLRMFVDGELVTDWPADYAGLSMNPQWALPDPSAMGLGTWASPTTFHRLEVRAVTGAGRVIRR
jgi:predicted Ser/Thr protein kinase